MTTSLRVSVPLATFSKTYPVGRVALLLRSSLRAFDIGSARLRHRIEAGDIRISRYRFAEFVGKMHATVNDDVMTFCDFAVMVWPRPAHLGPHGAWLTNNQLGRWWNLRSESYRRPLSGTKPGCDCSTSPV